MPQEPQPQQQKINQLRPSSGLTLDLVLARMPVQVSTIFPPLCTYSNRAASGYLFFKFSQAFQILFTGLQVSMHCINLSSTSEFPDRTARGGEDGWSTYRTAYSQSKSVPDRTCFELCISLSRFKMGQHSRGAHILLHSALVDQPCLVHLTFSCHAVVGP